MMRINEVMSTDLITIPPAADLETARSLMHENGIHHLPVVGDDEQLIGLVTLTNLLAATDSVLRDEDKRMDAAAIPVADIMVRDLATVDEHASLRQAALFLEKHKIGCLPVVADGKLRGIITDTDFVAVAINLLEQLELSESEDY